MTKFIVGFICGVVISTIGFSGTVRALDSGVRLIKDTASDAAIITETRNEKDKE